MISLGSTWGMRIIPTGTTITLVLLEPFKTKLLHITDIVLEAVGTYNVFNLFFYKPKQGSCREESNSVNLDGMRYLIGGQWSIESSNLNKGSCFFN
jgi:hypothetical protein